MKLDQRGAEVLTVLRHVVQLPEEWRKCADSYSNLNDNLRHWLVPSTCMRVSAPKPASTTPKTSLNFKIDASISFYSLSSPNETNVGLSSKNCHWATVSACIRHAQVSAAPSPNRSRLPEHLKELASFPTELAEPVGKKPLALRKGAIFRLIEPTKTKTERRKASVN